MRSALPVVVAILAGSILASSSPAGASELDPSFGNAGISVVRPPPGYTGEEARAVTADSRRRLIVAGATEAEGVLVRRYLPSGSPDPSFDGNGRVETSLASEAAANAVAVLRGGDLLVAGGTRTGLALIRYRPDGRRALWFGRRGHVVTGAGINGAAALALDVQSDGRILGAGYGIDLSDDWTGLLFAYRGDGSIDRRFADEGRAELTSAPETEVALNGVEVLPGGKILVGGHVGGRLVLGRLLANGAPDRSFGGGDGVVLVDGDGSRRCPCSYANAMTIDSGGRPVLAGVAIGPGRESSLLVRFRPDGRLDPSFGRHGIVRTRRGGGLGLNGVATRADGRITVTGTYIVRGGGNEQVAVLRYLPNGELDRRFADAGFFHRRVGLDSSAAAVIIRPDGSTVVAGSARFPAERFPEGGSPLAGSRVVLMKFRP